MREDPNGAALLQAAATLLRNDILAALPEHRRHGALMIANAMSIAMRQLEHGDAPEQRELAALRALLGHAGSESEFKSEFETETGQEAPMRALLVTLNRELAQRVRAGDADPGAALRDASLAHLRAAGRQRLLESSPKTLKPRP